MKIGFVGNANNYSLIIALAIKELGHEVVFIVESELPLNRPENLYTEFSAGYPAWMMEFNSLDLWEYPDLPEHTRDVLSALEDCDCLVLNEYAILLWQRLKKPSFLLLTGTDVEILSDPGYATARAEEETGGTWTNHLSSLHPMRLRRYFRRKRAFQQITRDIRETIGHAAGMNYFARGMIPNGDRILDDIGVDADRRVFFMLANLKRHPLIEYPNNPVIRIFNVARIRWKKPDSGVVSNLDYKGTDLMIKGVASFVRNSGIAVNLRLARKGPDIEATEYLIKQEGIQNLVTWMDELTQVDLLKEYEAADVVMDHFGDGSIGMGVLDAMATGRPVLTNCKPHIFERELGVTPPICQAKSAAEIAAQLTRLCGDREYRKQLGLESRRFVELFFAPSRAADLILEKLEAAS